ncbi:MAG: pantetheine-phosphate adenylyltransferase [Candidatus Heimdallarchaeota archaeon]|nr:pantetheine-phosphate adenylyltransferase [Candidatus Heimdallarchaeota archaeon]
MRNGRYFDRFHSGHESLLSTAAKMSKEVFVGIVSEELGKSMFINKEFSEKIEPYVIREAAVKNFMAQFKQTKIEVAPLYDPWGPAPIDPRADLIVVSQETKIGADKINQMRRENKLKVLDIIIIPWIMDDEGEIISSTKLRKNM